MHNILLIDRGDTSIHKFKKSLTNKGISLTNEHRLNEVIGHIRENKLDLIVIDNTLAPKLGKSKKFIQVSNNIPKLVLTDSANIKDSTLWIKDSSSYPVDKRITLKEFHSWVSRIIKNRAIEHDNRDLQTKLDTKEKELDFFYNITRVFNSTSDMDKSLDAIMNKALKMTESKAWTILLNDATLLKVKPVKASKKIRQYTFDKRISIAGEVMDKGVPLIITNTAQDKRYNEKVDKYPRMKINSVLCAPLIINNKIVGVAEIINKKPGKVFNDIDMNILVNASHYVSMAIKRALLYYKIEEISITDDLTNLYNIRYLDQAVDIEIERARRYRSMFSLVFMDIDNFKKVNDRYGHLVGSRVLIEMAQLLQEGLRKVDVVSRYGGDEFVIILPQTPRDSSFMVANRLRRMIEKFVFSRDEKLSIKLTASLGIASYPDDANNKVDLLKLADGAMYRGKFSTKNVVFSAS